MSGIWERLVGSRDLIEVGEDKKTGLRRPVGIPLFETPEESLRRLAILVDSLDAPLVVSVGDMVSWLMATRGPAQNVAVADLKVERRAFEVGLEESFPVVLRARNPRSTITREAWERVAEALELASEGERVLVLVEGEEDLLAVPAIVHSPDKSLVVYGQPGEGIVAVVVHEIVRKALLRYVLDPDSTKEILRTSS